MRFLLFSSDDLVPILDGKRQVDIRLHEPRVHDLLQGELFTGVFGEGIIQTRQVDMLARRNTRVIQLHAVDDAEARDAGYASALDFRQHLTLGDPTVTGESLVALSYFEIDSRSRTPVFMRHLPAPLFL